MYRAKQMASGYAVYTPEYDRRSPERLGLMAELRDAIEGGQLLLHFQPKVDIKASRIVGTEALVRWQHPRHGLLMPDKFIVAAEQTGLIGPLTRWVLTDALSKCQGACCEGIDLRVCVNLSARSLHDPHLLEMIEETLKASGAEPGRLTLEITESAIVLDPKRAEETLGGAEPPGRMDIHRRLRHRLYLARQHQALARQRDQDRQIIRAGDVGEQQRRDDRALGNRSRPQPRPARCGGGRETKEMFDAVAALGCDEAQGYFISRPQECELLKSWFPTSSWKLGLAT